MTCFCPVYESFLRKYLMRAFHLNWPWTLYVFVKFIECMSQSTYRLVFGKRAFQSEDICSATIGRHCLFLKTFVFFRICSKFWPSIALTHCRFNTHTHKFADILAPWSVPIACDDDSWQGRENRRIKWSLNGWPMVVQWSTISPL